MSSLIPNGNWEEVSSALTQRLRESRGDGQQLIHRVIEANERAAEAAYFSGVSLSARAQVRGGSVARVFWWGFHVEISHQDLPTVLGAADTVNTLVDLIGGSIPSPAQPWIKLLAPFISGTLQLLRALDRGRGIYISMSWFAPGAFVPTSV